MNTLNNKTLLTAVACAWLLTAAVFVVVRPVVSKSATPQASSTPTVETKP